MMDSITAIPGIITKVLQMQHNLFNVLNFVWILSLYINISLIILLYIYVINF